MYVATTRFSTETLLQSRAANDKCYYSPRLLSQIPMGQTVAVIEMNNDTNQVIGIGFIVKSIGFHDRKATYTRAWYNRVRYPQVARLDRAELDVDVETTEGPFNFLLLLEEVCFRGATHSKRSSGITLLPKVVMENTVFSIARSIEGLMPREKLSASRT